METKLVINLWFASSKISYNFFKLYVEFAHAKFLLFDKSANRPSYYDP